MTTTLGGLKAPFHLDATRGMKDFDKIQRRAVEFSAKVGSALSSVGNKLTMGLTVPLIGAAGAAVKFAVDANRGMANVATLIPGQTERVLELKDALNKLAIESGTDFVTLSDGLYQTISALGDTEQTISALTIANKASKAGIAETKDAINLLSGVSAAYGDTSDKMLGKISDLAFTTVKLGVTTFPELAESMGKTSTLAKTMGVSIEQLFGNYAALTSGTDNTAEVSTRLAAVMDSLMQGGEGLGKVYKKLGVKSGTALIEKTGGLNEALFALRKEVGGNVDAFSKLFGRKEAKIAALQLTGEKAAEAAREISAMGEAAGATDEAYRAQTEGVNKAEFTWKRTIERFKALARAIGDKIIPILERFGEKLEPIVAGFSNLSDAQIESGMRMAAYAAAVGPAIRVIGGLVTGVTNLVGFLSGGSGLTAALTALTGPVGITIAAVAALGLAVYYFWDQLKPVRDMLVEFSTGLLSDLSADVQGSAVSFQGLGDQLKAVVAFAAPVWAIFGKIGLTIATLPLRLLVKQVTAIADAFNKVLYFLDQVWRVGGYVKDMLAELWSGFAEGNPVVGSIADAFKSVHDWVSKLWSKFKDSAFVKFLGEAVGFVTNPVGAVTGKIGEWANTGANRLALASGSSDYGAKKAIPGLRDKLDITVTAKGGATAGVRSSSVKNVQGPNGEILPAGAI